MTMRAFLNNRRLRKHTPGVSEKFRSTSVARHRGPPCARRGLSLLEVMLALAILGLSLAAVGELMRIGSRNAELARDLSTAQILCESKMAEVVTGMLPAMPMAAAPIQDAGTGEDWLYEIATQQVGQNGLLAVRIVVQQNPEIFSRPASCSLVRWMINPNSLTTGSLTSDASTGSASPAG